MPQSDDPWPKNIVNKAIARIELNAPPEEEVTVREVLENAPLHSKRRVQNLYTLPEFPQIAFPRQQPATLLSGLKQITYEENCDG